MRRSFSNEIERLAAEDENLIFITGDLGFNAFENLRDKLGKRFINAGVAEQHMVGMAAGMAAKGHRVFVYSIAPFLVYRALEQIRNDLCFHKLPVCLVGNGGGYGYGIMGSSHHTLSDVGILSALPDMQVFVPAFDNDVALHLDAISKVDKPSYLRLGYGPEQHHYTSFNSIQQMNKAEQAKVTVFVMGPVLNNLLSHPEWEHVKNFADVFSVQLYPLKELPEEAKVSLRKTQSLLTAEEHYRSGGLAEQSAALILEAGIQLQQVQFRYALGYPDNTYGSQSFHQKQCGLDGDALITDIRKLIQDA